MRSMGKKVERHDSKASLRRQQQWWIHLCGSVEVPILVVGLTVSWDEIAGWVLNERCSLKDFWDHCHGAKLGWTRVVMALVMYNQWLLLQSKGMSSTLGKAGVLSLQTLFIHKCIGNFTVVQWLRLHFPMQGVKIPHTSWVKKPKHKNRSCTVTNSIKT